jgi:hypothetical protein
MLSGNNNRKANDNNTTSEEDKKITELSDANNPDLFNSEDAGINERFSKLI